MSAYAAYGRDLRTSHGTPEPRSAGPDKPIAIASSAGDNADANSAAQPDAILGKHRFVLVEPLREVVDELAHVFIEIVVSIVWHAADAPRVTRQSRAKLPFENLQNLFAFAQRPEQNGDGADIERVRCQPEQVRSDAIELSKNRAQVMRARRNGSPIICSTVSTHTKPFETAAM